MSLVICTDLLKPFLLWHLSILGPLVGHLNLHLGLQAAIWALYLSSEAWRPLVVHASHLCCPLVVPPHCELELVALGVEGVPIHHMPA